MSTETATTVTPASALPQWEGRPVPWITRWTGQLIPAPVGVDMVGGRLHLSYRDGNETRERSGVLWLREGLNRSGRPEFSQVSTYRQRACMTRRKCQVCGNKIDDRPIRWLMPRVAMGDLEEGVVHTISAPTCAACIPLALELCPHLRAEDWVILKVADYEIYGVYGDAVIWNAEAGGVQEIKGVMLPYAGMPNPGAVVAKQQVAEITKFVVEETS